MARQGVEMLGLNHRGSRYFLQTFLKSNQLNPFLFSDLMAQVCQATLGDTAYLFFEQYVVKAPEKGLKFSWHQDSGYVGYPHRPYLTCWCPLDDVDESNGTIYILPYSVAGTREMKKHVHETQSNDQVGYFGDEPGTPVIVPAGSMVCFSSTLFHRSGFNTSHQIRRAYIAQYSAEPILTEDGTKPLQLAEPFILNGQRVK